MMPYLAVIVDSFRSALASRILWVAFIAIWILLLGLAPIGYHEDYTTEFRWFDLDNGTQMKAMLARGLVDPSESETALGRMSKSFPDGIQRKLRQVAQGDDIRIDKAALAESLNESLDDESWYDEQAWQSTVRLRELRELDEIADDKITEPERRRRARLRIEAALPGVFAARSARSIMLSYAGFDFPAIFSIGKPQFVSLINQFVIPFLLDWLLGFALIFLGILVTASIVPEMLEPGSLHLLLSKPISRTLLLLSKFLGGCAFVFLCVCQIVVGLWLIAGLRLDIWNSRILWCIPVSVFLFAVFYSVSTLAGLRWRSPILSVGITCMFGAFVLVIGILGGYFDALVKRPDEIRNIALSGEEVIVSTRGGGLKRFNQEDQSWESLFEDDFRRRDLIVPPVRIDQDHFATARIRNGRFNLYGSGSLDLLILGANKGFEPRPSFRLPVGTRRLFAIDQMLVAMNNNGLTKTDVSQAIEAVSEEDESDDESELDQDDTEIGDDNSEGTDTPKKSSSIGVTAWINDLIRMQGGATEDFESILPRNVTLSDPLRVVQAGASRVLIVYTRGRLLRLELPDPQTSDSSVAKVVSDVIIEGDDSARTEISATSDSVLVARNEEPIRWFDAKTLKQVAEFEPPKGMTVLSVCGIDPLDQFAYLTTDGACRIASRNSGGIESRTLVDSDVVTIDFDAASSQVAIAHNIDQIDFYRVSDGDSLELAGSIDPSLESWRKVDQWVITPLRTITPQTGEFSQTIASLVSGKSSFAFSDGQSDDPEVVQLKIARPLISCSTFLVVMLAISCVYFSRSDF